MVTAAIVTCVRPSVNSTKAHQGQSTIPAYISPPVNCASDFKSFKRIGKSNSKQFQPIPARLTKKTRVQLVGPFRAITGVAGNFSGGKYLTGLQPAIIAP